MKKLKNMFNILHNNNSPVKTVIGKIIMRLPFDIGKIVSFKIKTQDYFLRFRQSAMVISYWIDPNGRIADYNFIKSYLKKSNTYIDVGANIGTTLIPAAKVVREGNAIGFEPHPKIFSNLKENIKLNNLSNKVELHNCALGNKRGELNFTSLRNDDSNKIIVSGKGISVPVNLLNDFATKYDNIDLLKIDVEGYEKFVIEGGLDVIRKTQCIYFEMSEEQYGFYDYKVKDLLELFEKMNFNIYLQKEPKTIELIDKNHELKVHHLNAFAIRDIDNFLNRTGWQVHI